MSVVSVTDSVPATGLSKAASSEMLAELNDPNLLPHKHIPALDAVRGVAILLVMGFHFTMMTENPDNKLSYILSKTTVLGRCGVDLFFVLSGFLITGLLYDAKGSQSFFKTFYSRRILRILPLYFGSLVLFIWLLPPLTGFRPDHYDSLVQNQLWLWLHAANIGIILKGGSVLGGLGHLWSLAVEEHFYLLWPAVLFLFNRKTLLRVCVGVMIGSFAVRLAIMLAGDHVSAIAAPGFGPQDICYIFTPGRFEQFAMGGWVAVVARGPQGLRPLVKAAKWLAPISFAMLITILAVRERFRTPGKDDILMPTIGYSIVGLAFASCIILAIAQPKLSRMGKVINSSFLRMFGKYSYALYIFHVAVYDVVLKYFPIPRDATIPQFAVKFLILATVSFILSLVAAWLSWNLWEKHFLALKRYFNYSTAPTVSPTIATPAFKPAHNTTAVHDEPGGVMPSEAV